MSCRANYFNQKDWWRKSKFQCASKTRGKVRLLHHLLQQLSNPRLLTRQTEVTSRTHTHDLHVHFLLVCMCVCGGGVCCRPYTRALSAGLLLQDGGLNMASIMLFDRNSQVDRVDSLRRAENGGGARFKKKRQRQRRWGGKTSCSRSSHVQDSWGGAF